MHTIGKALGNTIDSAENLAIVMCLACEDTQIEVCKYLCITVIWSRKMLLPAFAITEIHTEKTSSFHLLK